MSGLFGGIGVALAARRPAAPSFGSVVEFAAVAEPALGELPGDLGELETLGQKSVDVGIGGFRGFRLAGRSP